MANVEPQEKNRIIMGVDVSTKCIGVTLLLDDGSEYGKVIEVTHVRPKAEKGCKGIEELVKKCAAFKEYITKFSDYKIDEIIIEEPLMASTRGLEAVTVLLKFNGMLASALYEVFKIAPKYISSYDARKYAFPTLLSVRKRNKEGAEYPYKKLINDVKKGHLVLFGSMAWDVDKKAILQEMVAEKYPDIEWIYNKKGNLAAENYDASDSMVAALGWMHLDRYGVIKNENIKITNIVESEGKIEYDVNYWDRCDHKVIYVKKSPEA